MGTIRGVESMSLALLRLIGEEARKERTGRVIAQVPVDVATYLINEKREWLNQIESRDKVSLVIVPNPHMQTPAYTLRRIRDDEKELPENTWRQLSTGRRSPAFCDRCRCPIRTSADGRDKKPRRDRPPTRWPTRSKRERRRRDRDPSIGTEIATARASHRDVAGTLVRSGFRSTGIAAVSALLAGARARSLASGGAAGRTDADAGTDSSASAIVIAVSGGSASRCPAGGRCGRRQVCGVVLGTQRRAAQRT
jgi:hypothetical protein